MKFENLKVSDLVEMQPALLELSAVKLPAKISYRVSRLLSQVKPDWEAFVKAHQELFNRLSDETTAPNGEPGRIIPKERRAEFEDEAAKLKEEPISHIEFEPVKIADLGEAEISPSSLLALQLFIVE